MRSSDRISKLTLVASDMAYAAEDPTFAQRGSDLRVYNDSSPLNYRPAFALEQGFRLESVITESQSGFKAMIFANATEVIVAFAGTDGLNANDWAANSLHLGWNQWTRNGSRVLSAIQGFADLGHAIHFTGQSLGGALAEYAAYDFLTGQRPSERQPPPCSAE